jgi:hypothetical protein
MLIESLGFLRKASGICIYRIDIATIEQYVSEHMKEKLRQLTLFDLRLRQEEDVKAENT